MKAGVICMAAFALVALAVRAERIALTNGVASCLIDTNGGRVVSYCVNGVETLWNPASAVPADEPWAHGGIPLAWPWFGRIGRGDADIHGYAWKSAFTVKRRTLNGVVLTLETETALLEYAISLEPALTLRLHTVNRSAHAMPLGQAFHPYFRVAERDDTTVEGVFPEKVVLSDAIDRGVCFGKVEKQRVYRLCDGREKRILRIEAQGSTGVNVWNPGAGKCPGTVPGDEWRRFVAIEPYAMGKNRFMVLEPGDEHVLVMSVRVE